MEKNKITFKVIFILLALFSLVFPLYPGSSEYTNNGEWPVYRGSLTGTRATDVFGALSPFILWNFTYSAVDRGDGRGSFIPESSPASVVLGTVFIANNAGQVTAINITDGSIIWEKNVSNAGAPVCIGPPAIISTSYPGPSSLDQVKIFVSCTEGVFALNGSNGDIIWNNTGIWNFAFGSPDAPLIVFNGNVYGSAKVGFDTILFSLSSDNGNILNSVNITSNESQGPVVIWSSGGYLYKAVKDGINGYIIAFNPSDLSIGWIFSNSSLDPALSSPSLAQVGNSGTINDFLLLVTDGDEIYAINASTGTLSWRKQIDSFGRTYNTPSFENGVIYLGAYNDTFYALNATNGNIIWTYVSNGTIFEYRNAVIGGNGVFVATADGFAVFNKSNGNLLFNYNEIGSLGILSHNPEIALVSYTDYGDDALILPTINGLFTFGLKCGITINQPGNYNIYRNLTLTGSSPYNECININQSNVSLICDGSIDILSKPNSAGVKIKDVENVNLTQCSIIANPSNNEIGLYVENASNVIADQSIIYTIYANNSNNLTFKAFNGSSSVVIANSTNIYVIDSDIDWSNNLIGSIPSFVNIENLTVKNSNLKNKISINSIRNALFENITTKNSSSNEFELYAFGSDNVSIVKNNFTNGRLSLNNVTNSLIDSNVFNNSLFNGSSFLALFNHYTSSIYISGVSNSTIINNTINSYGYGILISDILLVGNSTVFMPSRDNLIFNNTINNSLKSDMLFVINDSSPSALDNCNNNITNNIGNSGNEILFLNGTNSVSSGVYSLILLCGASGNISNVKINVTSNGVYTANGTNMTSSNGIYSFLSNGASLNNISAVSAPYVLTLYGSRNVLLNDISNVYSLAIIDSQNLSVRNTKIEDMVITSDRISYESLQMLVNSVLKALGFPVGLPMTYINTQFSLIVSDNFFSSFNSNNTNPGNINFDNVTIASSRPAAIRSYEYNITNVEVNNTYLVNPETNREVRISLEVDNLKANDFVAFNWAIPVRNITVNVNGTDFVLQPLTDKFIEIKGEPSVRIKKMSILWNDSEIAGLDENNFELWRFSANSSNLSVSPWRSFGYDAAKTFAIPNARAPTSNRTLWPQNQTRFSLSLFTAFLSALAGSSFSADEENIYFKAPLSPLLRINKATGFVLDIMPTMIMGNSVIALNDRILIPDQTNDINGRYYALRKTDLQPIWIFNYTGSFTNIACRNPTVIDDIAYIPYQRLLYAVNTSNGNIIWNFSTVDGIVSSPAFGNGYIIITNPSAMYALNATNGNLEWSKSKQYLYQPSIYNGKVYVLIKDQYKNINVTAYNITTGNEIWVKTVNVSSPLFLEFPCAAPRHVAINNDILVFTALDGITYAVNATTGADIWNYSTNNSYGPIILNDTVIIGSEDGLYALDLYSGSIKWKYAEPIFDALGLFADNGVVYAMLKNSLQLQAFGSMEFTVPIKESAIVDQTENSATLNDFVPSSIYGLFYNNISSPSPPPSPPSSSGGSENKPLSISTSFICPDNVLRVTLNSNGNKVSDARVTVRNNQINYLEGRNTDENGIALFNINQGGNYNIEAHKSGYEDAEKTISITICPKEQMNETKNETKQPSTERETPITVQPPPPERIVILAPEQGFVGDNITIAVRYENGTEAKGIKITIVTRDKPIELITNEQGFAYYVAYINGYYIYTSDNPIAKSTITYIKEKEVKEYRIEVPLRIVRTTPVYITPNTIGPFTLEVYLGNQLISSQTGVGRASLTLPEGNYKVVIRSSNAIRGANIDIPFEPQTIKINTVEFFAIALFIALGFTLILFIRDYLRQREKMRKEKTESS